MTTGRTDTKFSERLREATKHAHAGAQGSAFVRELFAGKLNRGLYSRMVAQHYFIYAALEDTAATMSSDPTARAFLAPELARVPSLERDLEFLLGDGWRDQIAPTAATVAYVERISETAGDSAGFVAHHYVRYLGDLSGGQHIARAIAKALDLDADGVRFYLFEEIGDPNVFKDRYRAALDEAAWDEPRREALIAEALAAYELNTRVMLEL